MRPRNLISVRAKRGRRLSSHGIRIVDQSSLVLITILICDAASRRSLLDTSVGDVGPFVVAALVFGRALRSLGLYRFVRSESLLRHLIQLAAAWIAAMSALLITRLLFDGEPGIWTCGQWGILAAATLGALHVIWWLTVRSWRSNGWLTPNVVIVGATTQAESIISEAMARGHVNVVGVFDDRLERNPSAVLGVPVLGDVDALLSHRIIPFVDRVVIAIEPGAVDRIREIATRLAVLPNEVTLFLDQRRLDPSVGAGPDRRPSAG